MLLELTADQEFLRETTDRFLTEFAPVAELRRLRDEPAGFESDFWTRGTNLGWTSLLVDERHGGGSVSGDGLVDLTLLAHEFGRHAAPGPLTPTNVVVATLSEMGADTPVELVSEVLDGTSVVAWCAPSGASAAGGVDALRIRADGDDLVVDGVARPVEAAGSAHHLLVTGRSDTGLTQVLVPVDATGVAIAPMQTVDLTRRFSTVTFDATRIPARAAVGEIGRADAQVERQTQRALVIANAESIGAMQAAFDMTVAWAFDRYSFGRPLASYQALKHRFADMKAWLEAGHAISDEAAAAISAGDPAGDELVSAAKAFIGGYGAELMQECVQLHGGIGVTFEHDLHVFLRRHTLNRALYGTPVDHRLRLADLVEAAGGAA